MLDSLKHGLTVFVALLFSLGLLEYIMSIVQGKSATMLDELDVATAFVGFVLIFAGKFLEKLHGKR